MLKYPRQLERPGHGVVPRLANGNARREERVLEILCEGFPGAPIHTLFHNRNAISETINSHEIKTSYLQNIPGIMNFYRNLLPLFPGAIEKDETIRRRPRYQHQPLRRQGNSISREDKTPLLLLHPYALRMDVLRRVLRLQPR